MSGGYVGAVDQGTTGTRFMVFDRAGRVKASAYQQHRQITPAPGWVARLQASMAPSGDQRGKSLPSGAVIGVSTESLTPIV